MAPGLFGFSPSAGNWAADRSFILSPFLAPGPVTGLQNLLIV